MYNPEIMDNSTLELLTESLVGMSGDSEGALILENVLNTGAIVETNAQDHLGSYSTMLSNIPGISAYYSEKYDINETVSPNVDRIRLAFEVKSDYENIDENPQLLADYLSEKLGISVEIYPVSSEGAIIEALRFGTADLAFMDGGAAWVGWKEYGLATMAADQKSDGRTYYDAHAWVRADSEMANAYTEKTVLPIRFHCSQERPLATPAG